MRPQAIEKYEALTFDSLESSLRTISGELNGLKHHGF
jgi:hypothetical protein